MIIQDIKECLNTFGIFCSGHKECPNTFGTFCRDTKNVLTHSELSVRDTKNAFMIIQDIKECLNTFGTLLHKECLHDHSGHKECPNAFGTLLFGTQRMFLVIVRDIKENLNILKVICIKASSSCVPNDSLGEGRKAKIMQPFPYPRFYTFGQFGSSSNPERKLAPNF
ncbi:hypothetical protein CEXT_721911 [Caerostris extrusa]|uniref:Uncharacterized protein n=1 Tax=Caerostris extrusa TaxID=172846 RepID=A0AAV4R5K3_CAEEX|nr:hypothetical protein CEXT_721911 [Caerostris extrusa]